MSHDKKTIRCVICGYVCVPGAEVSHNCTAQLREALKASRQREADLEATLQQKESEYLKKMEVWDAIVRLERTRVELECFTARQDGFTRGVMQSIRMVEESPKMLCFVNAQILVDLLRQMIAK